LNIKDTGIGGLRPSEREFLDDREQSKQRKQSLGPVVAEARQGKCHLWAEGRGEVFGVNVEGLEPGESFEEESTSNGETISTRRHAKADGTWGVALFPAVLGKHSGTVTFTIKSSRCHLAIEFPWYQDVNAKAPDGSTALMAASEQGQFEAVRALLAAQADVNAKTTDGTTALIQASQEGHREVVELLKGAGAKE